MTTTSLIIVERRKRYNKNARVSVIVLLLFAFELISSINVIGCLLCVLGKNWTSWIFWHQWNSGMNIFGITFVAKLLIRTALGVTAL